jgi:hypothetical protein
MERQNLVAAVAASIGAYRVVPEGERFVVIHGDRECVRLDSKAAAEQYALNSRAQAAVNQICAHLLRETFG